MPCVHVECTHGSVVPDPNFRSLGSGFLDNFLDPEPDWISFLLKPDPDTDYPNRYAWNTFYFFAFRFFAAKFF